ncbi:MAG TPA: S8 family serine peptidase [Longimicrobium sp.]|uniref:S8 family peptidase n=1 Tax=Longimicrobium sp. TaxID=2029185 RepID=UPI002EDA3EE6
MFQPRMAAAALLALGLAACSDQPSAPSGEARPEPLALQQRQDEVVPGEILVKMKDGISLTELTGRTPGLRLERRLAERSRIAVLGVARGQERAEAARLSADPRVEYAEPNYVRRINAINPALWAFYNPGGLQAQFNTSPYGYLPSGYTSITDADQDNIEGIAVGGAQVVIGSLDTGADTDHPEIAANLILGWDWANGDALPEDDNGHGTHTIGTMVGATVGVAGVTGAGTNVKVYVQKVCTATGSCPTANIVNAIYAAADYPGMVAMNLSLSGPSISTAEVNAINYAVNTKGVLVIASAGNGNTSTVGCPACNVNSISVSATNWRDARAYYSQYGSGLDISAPGGELYSNTTNVMGIYSAYLAGGYAYLQGTSMAAPQVTGAAGVVASVTGLTGASLRARLQNTADDKGALGYDVVFGNGRLNVYRAITNSTLAYPL